MGKGRSIDESTALPVGSVEYDSRRLVTGVAGGAEATMADEPRPDPGVTVGDINAFTGAPRLLQSHTSSRGTNPMSAASAFLASVAATLNPRCGTNTHYVPDGCIQRTSTGTAIVHFRQHYLGIPVFDATRSVILDEANRVTQAVGDTMPVPDSIDVTPVLPAPEAVVAACTFCAERVAGPDGRNAPLRVSRRRPAVISAAALPSRPTVLRKPPCEDVVTAELTIFFDGAEARLAWNIAFVLPRRLGSFNVVVAADRREPRVLFSRRISAHGAAEAFVYEFNPSDAPGSIRPLPRPESEYPRLSRPRPATFPRPWVEGQETRGNNVESIGSGKKVLKGKRAGGVLRFDPGDHLGWDQATVNAFYLCNFAHDFFDLLGFDEASGNFQKSNFANAGAADDRLEVWVFEGDQQSDMENRADGKPPRMVLGKWGNRYAALDADMVLHEYTHGVTDRLIGGRNTPHPLRHGEQSKALGEGYSDYFAMSIQNYYRRAAGVAEKNAFGAWIGNDPARGLRRHAYTDTFPGTFALLGRPEYREPHDAGQVWACVLLVTARSVGTLLNDRNAGDFMCWQAVVDSLKRVRTGSDAPGFLDARDAFLPSLEAVARGGPLAAQADAIVSQAHACFTSFGMGGRAKSPSASFDGLVADFGT